MSTITPSGEDEGRTVPGADPGSRSDTAATGGAARRSPSRSTRLATGTDRPDRWADSTADPQTHASPAAPLTFDPACTRRLRNRIDGENAALPDAR